MSFNPSPRHPLTMSSVPSTIPTLSKPSKHENLVGAVLWLPSVDHIPDHGRYKLKAKACDHPCLVVQDCRTANDDTVKICILASYSQETSYNALGKTEKFDHVPIHPNPPNDRTEPNIVYLRPRQNNGMFLRRNSWVNTRRIYKVPVAILRPYENHRSWCRYRLAETSIRALQSALFPENTDTEGALSPPMSSDSPFTSDEQLVSPNREMSPDGDMSSQVSLSERAAVAQSEPHQPQLQSLNVDMNDLDGANTTFTEACRPSSMPQRGSPSDEPSPFHLIYPLDRGPRPKAPTETRSNCHAIGSIVLLVGVLFRCLLGIQKGRPYAWNFRCVVAAAAAAIAFLSFMSLFAAVPINILGPAIDVDSVCVLLIGFVR